MNQSNITQTTLNHLIFLYACSPTATIGLLLTSISFIVFSNAQFKNQRLFSYFKLDTLFMLADLAIKSLYPILYNPKSSLLTSQIYLIYLHGYMSSILEICQIGANIFAAFSCLSMLENNSKTHPYLNYLTNLRPLNVTLTWFALATLLFAHQALSNDLLAVESFTVNFHFFSLVAFVIRDGVCVLVLIVLNCLIAKKTRQILTNKSILIGNNKDSNIKESQKKTIKMVLADSLNTIAGRVPILVYFLIVNGFPSVRERFEIEIFEALAVLTVYLSYLLKFFIFYNFNKRFREILTKRFRSIRPI